MVWRGVMLLVHVSGIAGGGDKGRDLPQFCMASLGKRENYMMIYGSFELYLMLR